MAQVPVPGTLSVIIPTLEEELSIGRCLKSLAAQRPSRFQVEVLCVDGGSHDATIAQAVQHGADRILETSPGRGAQMAAGAEVARGSVLLFLHADCELPPGALQRIEHTLGPEPYRGDPIGGAFHVRHVSSDTSGRITRRLIRIADRRSHRTRFPYGDQAVFVTAEAYHAAGGMPTQPLMEDLEFARRLRAQGRLATVPMEVLTSGRRFEGHPFRTVACWWSFPLLYRMGVSPERLWRWYGNVRASRK